MPLFGPLVNNGVYRHVGCVFLGRVSPEKLRPTTEHIKGINNIDIDNFPRTTLAIIMNGTRVGSLLPSK